MKFLKLIALVVSVVVFTGCTNNKNNISDDSIDIVTSFYPIYSIAQEITKNSSNVNLINMTTPSTGCLHDYQLTSGDMKKLSGADLFIINGGDMESFISNIEKSLPNLQIIDTSIGTHMLESAGHTHSHYEEHEDHNHEECEILEHEHEDHSHEECEILEHTHDEHTHEHIEETEIASHIHNEDDGHDHGSTNAHIWLSPENAAIQAENICNALCSIDSVNSNIYTENLKSFKSKVNQLINETSDINFEGKSAAVFHEGYSYFADWFGFDILAEIYMDENTDPSPQLLANTIDTVNKNNIEVLLCADDASLKIAETVANETNAKIYVIDPLTYGNENNETYTDIMKRNTYIIKEAFQ